MLMVRLLNLSKNKNNFIKRFSLFIYLLSWINKFFQLSLAYNSVDKTKLQRTQFIVLHALWSFDTTF